LRPGLDIIAAGKFVAWEAGHRPLERLTVRRSRRLDKAIAGAREEREARVLATDGPTP
jgi:hypothetical protein